MDRSTVVTVVAVSALIAMICAADSVYIDIRELQAGLDKLYWISDNTHSGLVTSIIRRVELRLQQKQMSLTLLLVAIATTILALISYRILKHKRMSKITTQCLIGFLLFVVLTPVVSAREEVEAVTHYYARVEMDVPMGSHLLDVHGYITPQPAGVVNNWVCYHIGVGFPLSEEWRGGGYYTELGIGTVFYIEWVINGVYSEITASGVSFGEQYQVDVYKFDSGELEGWGTNIYDSNWNLVLRKSNVDLPLDDPEMLGIAGGESIYPANCMRASFSGLRWMTYDDPFEEGSWDGNKFSCSVIHDSPYTMAINAPYYDFSVSGGTGRTLVISSSKCGTTDPAAGIYGYSYGSYETVWASAYSGYTFDYWLLDGAKLYGYPITVRMDFDHTLEPYFRDLGVGGGSSGGGSGKPPICVPYWQR